MESMKEKFDNLTESEKITFLLECVGKCSEDESSLFNTIKKDLPSSGQKRGCAESSPEENPRKKQKIVGPLDRWLIKSPSPQKKIEKPQCSPLDRWLIKSPSPKKNIEKSPCKNTEPVNGDSLIVSEKNSPSSSKAGSCSENVSTSISLHAVHDQNNVISENNSQSTSEAPSCSENVSTSKSLHAVHDQDRVSGKSESVISKVVTNDTCEAKTNEATPEKYNLRRSKRTKLRNNCSCCSGTVSKNSSKKESIDDNTYELLPQNCRNRDLRTCNASEHNADLEPSKFSKSPKSKKTDPNHNTSQQAQCTESNICKNNNNIGTSPDSRTKTNKLVDSDVRKLNKNAACDGNQLTIQSQGDQDVRTAPLLSDYEAYCKLNEEFSNVGLNIVDVVDNEKIQNLLCDQKSLDNEAVVFIGTFKSDTGEILPVVHQIQSKIKLLESLSKLKKKIIID